MIGLRLCHHSIQPRQDVCGRQISLLLVGDVELDLQVEKDTLKIHWSKERAIQLAPVDILNQHLLVGKYLSSKLGKESRVLLANHAVRKHL